MTQRIAKYEILEKIAEGGFGVVYRARDPFIKRQVAIKTCSVANDEMARRFYREAEIAGRFDHPNVTIVHDFGVEGQLAYLVQEYLTGEDLLAKIRRRDPLPIGDKVGWLLQIASGLAYAHSKDVIHRDIKPANLRVLEDGSVKILDFGIAKLVSGATQLTQKGIAVGTLGYLSPEQLRDQELDTRTDIFSFGVVAYELITYQKPFQARQLSLLMEEILQREPPPISTLAPDCPPALEAVVRRCLAKERAERYQSFEDVILALEAVRRGLGDPAAAAGARAPAKGAASRPGDDVEGDESITKPIPLSAAPAAVASHRSPAPPPLPPPRVLPPLPVAAASPPPPPPATPPPGSLLPPIESVVADTNSPTVVLRSVPAPPAARAHPPVLPPTAVAPEPAWDAPPPAAVLGASAAPPASGPGAPPAARRWLPWLAAALVLAAVGLGLVWALLARRGVEPRPRDAAAPAPARTDLPAPAAAGRTALMVIAAPWAELQSVRGADGAEQPLPADRTTPLLLDLGPGRYTLTLSHPSAKAPATCEAEVVAGQGATCRVEALQVEVMRYFKEAGWWG